MKKLNTKRTSKNYKKIKRTELILERIKEKLDTDFIPDIVNLENGFELINQLSLSILFDKRIDEEFECLLSKHSYNDARSSSIVKYKDVEYYHCKYCNNGKPMSPSDTLFLLMGRGPLQMQKTLFRWLGRQITNPSREQQQQTIAENLSLIESFEDSKEFPLLKKNKLLTLYKVFLEYAIDRLPYKSYIENHIVISIPLTALSNHLQREKYVGADKGTLSRKTNLLTLLGLLEKVNYSRLPKYVVRENAERKSKANQENYYDKTYWNIPSITIEDLIHAENLLHSLKKNRIKLKDFNAAKYMCVLGDEGAREIYPSKKFYQGGIDEQLIIYNVEESLRIKQWFTLSEMKKINANSKLVPYVLDRLLYEEKVIKVKISKMYREKYDIPNEINRNSFIYIEKRKSIDVAA